MDTARGTNKRQRELPGLDEDGLNEEQGSGEARRFSGRHTRERKFADPTGLSDHKKIYVISVPEVALSVSSFEIMTMC